MTNVRRLYFGKDDAETDFTRSGLLQNGFLRTTVYESLKSNGGKSLVVGRKGSGKSALCLMLHRQFRAEAFASIITPDAISADELKRFEVVGIDDQQSKKLVWRYIFLVQICKFILEVARQESQKDTEWPIDVGKVRQFLVENQEVDDLNFQDNFWRVINRIKTAFKISAFGQSIEVDAGQAPSEGLGLSRKLDFLERYLKPVLNDFCQHKFYLLVDKVDEIWDNDRRSDQMVIGLLMAAREVNLISDNVHCIVFLRSDIYDQIQFFDKDKFRGDEEQIIWTKDLLQNLIVARARLSTRDDSLESANFWSNYFPETANGETAFDFIIAHTLMRPRDIIQLCNLCADSARRDGGEFISGKVITQSLDVYSNWKLNDLIGEYRVNYPFLNDLLVLFSNTSYVIPKRRFETLYTRVESQLIERNPTYRGLLTSDAVLNILYSIGFIGVERVGKVVYYYQDPRTVEERDRNLVVHPAFRNALKCTSSVDIQPYTRENYEERELRLQREIVRGRSPARFALERRNYPEEYELLRLADRLEGLRKVLIREDQLPAEVVGEISRNLGVIIEEIRSSEDRYPDPVRSEMLRIRVIRYMSQLTVKLTEMGFIQSSKSPLMLELSRLFDERFYK